MVAFCRPCEGRDYRSSRERERPEPIPRVLFRLESDNALAGPDLMDS